MGSSVILQPKAKSGSVFSFHLSRCQRSVKSTQSFAHFPKSTSHSTRERNNLTENINCFFIKNCVVKIKVTERTPKKSQGFFGFVRDIA